MSLHAQVLNFLSPWVWRFGELLLRRLRFNARAILISFVFSVPIAALSVAYIADALRILAVVQDERAGLEGIVVASDLLQAISSERERLVSGLGSGRDVASPERGAQSTSYVDVRRRLVEYVSRHPIFTAVKDVVEGLPSDLPNSSLGGSADQATETFELQTQAASDTLLVIARLIESSRLDQDSEAIGQALIKGVLVNLPVLLEKSREISMLGNMAVRAHGADEFQRRVLADQIPIVEYLDGALDESIRRAGEFSETLKLALNPKDESGRTAELRGSARALTTADELRVQPEAFSSSARRVIIKLEEFQGRGIAELRGYLKAREDVIKQRQLTILSLIGSSLLLAFYLFVSFGRVTKGGMRLLASHIERLRVGNLSIIPPSHGRDEVADLVEDLRRLQESLAAIVSEVRHSSVDVYSASDSLSSDAASLLDRNQQSNVRILEVADAAANLETTFRVSVGSISKAEALSKSNADSAMEAQVEIAKWQEVMTDLKRRSAKIHEITDLINEIAFRTNLLALNAAVEAAKAGESGKGFAVIAGDVRQLSKTTAHSAQEIQRMLSDTMAKVDMCARMGDVANAQMDCVVENASGIGCQLTRVALDSQKSADEVARVSAVLAELRALTIQSSAEVEHTRGSVENLLVSAANLEARVEVFRLP